MFKCQLSPHIGQPGPPDEGLCTPAPAVGKRPLKAESAPGSKPMTSVTFTSRCGCAPRLTFLLVHTGCATPGSPVSPLSAGPVGSSARLCATGLVRAAPVVPRAGAEPSPDHPGFGKPCHVLVVTSWVYRGHIPGL